MIIEKFSREENEIVKLIRELFEETLTDTNLFYNQDKKSDHLIVLEFNVIINNNTYEKFKSFFDFLDNNCDDWKLYIWNNKFKCLIIPDVNFVNSLKMRKNSKKYNL